MSSFGEQKERNLSPEDIHDKYESRINASANHHELFRGLYKSNTQSDRNASYKETVSDTKKEALKAISHGVRTLENLQVQEENLIHTEDTLEANEFVIQKSLKVLRGMTWVGMVYNAFTSEPEPSVEPSHERIDTSKIIESKNISSECKSSVIENNQFNSKDDEDILEISQSVQQMYDISVAMTQYLDNQNSSLERIQTKTEKIHEDTLAATLKSSRIIQRHDKTQGVDIGKFQFIDTVTGFYLCVENYCLELTDKPKRSSYFQCYKRHDNLIGLQNCKTMKYLGTTYYGVVKVSGDYWGKMEDCWVNLTGAPSGILILSRNWGSGGWLKSKIHSDGTIYDTTSGIHDKEDILIVKAVKIAESNNDKRNDDF